MSGEQYWQQSGQWEYEAWLQDTEAQAEYQQYLDQLNAKDSTWDDIRKTQAAATFNKRPPDRT